MLTILFYKLQHILLVFFTLGYRQEIWSELHTTLNFDNFKSLCVMSSTVRPLSLTSQKDPKKLWTTFNEKVLQRFFGAILCQDIINSEFNCQLFSAYDFHHGTSAHYTLKDFESRAAFNNLSLLRRRVNWILHQHFLFKNCLTTVSTFSQFCPTPCCLRNIYMYLSSKKLPLSYRIWSMMVLTSVIQKTTAPIANVTFCLNFLSIIVANQLIDRC